MGEVSFLSAAQALSHRDSSLCIMTESPRSSAALLPPTTSGYPDLMTPYSAVSSFNYPTRADTTLLTPVSTVGSPPMNNNNNNKFPADGYAASSGPGDDASPASSRMYPWYPLDMAGQSSQEGSPMNGPPAPAHHPQHTPGPGDFMAGPPGYLSSSAPQQHPHHQQQQHAAAMRRLTPGPPDNVYTGSYSVSDAAAADPSHSHPGDSSHYYMAPHMTHASGLIPRSSSDMHLDGSDAESMRGAPQHHHQQPLPALLSHHQQQSVMHHHHPQVTPMTGGSPSPDRSRGATRRRGTASSSAAVPGAPSSTSSSRSARKSRSGPSGGRKGGGFGGSGAGGSGVNPYPLEEHQNCHGQEVAPRLKLDCPPEERCIFEARWANRRKKGHDMWESIQSAFEQRFEQKYNKEMLQMRFKRARSKYYDWLPKDDEILREAFVEMEKERYETLLDKFYEKGGSRNMQLSAADIEVKLATDLRLEEGFYIETAQPDLHVRRRQRKTNARKRSARGGAGSVTAAGAGGADEGEAGVAGGNDDLSSVASHTTVNDDEVIRQVYSYRPPHQHGLY